MLSFNDIMCEVFVEMRPITVEMMQCGEVNCQSDILLLSLTLLS